MNHIHDLQYSELKDMQEIAYGWRKSNNMETVMPSYLRLIGIIFVLCSLSGCSQIELYRTNSQVTIDALDGKGICTFWSDQMREGQAELCSLQHHYYDAGRHDENEEKRPNYYLGFVEFDDQGWMADRHQMDSLINFLYAKGKEKDLLVVVFAHGWQHNASSCDTNVICFRRVLERLDVLEKKYNGDRTIVGVYVGWRGLSATVLPFNYLSFWERKNTSDKVGHGGVTELLVKLDDFQKATNILRPGSKTHLLITGHSFGGQVIYSALSQILIDRAGEINFQGNHKSSGEYNPVDPFGNLVVLVNPAFEGAKYEPLFDLARHRTYSDSQPPVMLVVTSQTDLATKLAFPLGRYMSTFWERSQSDEKKETILYTVGHLARYQTHELSLNENLLGKNAWEDKGTMQEGDCPYLSSTKEFVAHYYGDGAPEQASVSGNWYLSDDNTFYGNEYNFKIHPKSLTKDNPRYPYWVVSTHKNIIPNHNQIYQPAFINFLQRFYFKNIYRRQ